MIKKYAKKKMANPFQVNCLTKMVLNIHWKTKIARTPRKLPLNEIHSCQ